MPDKILLNNEIYNISEADLPCLIHYAPKEGGSHFSVTMVADLFLRGEKILFFTAYPMAKENFMEQLKGHESEIAYITDINQLDTSKQAIIIESGDEELLLAAIDKLADIKVRIVLLKNMEVFSSQVIESCLKMNKIIFSGNLDECVNKQQIAAKDFNTIVLFSQPETQIKINAPQLEKYTGYLWSKEIAGLVKIQKN